MNHAAFPASTSEFRCEIHESVYFPVKIAIWYISPVFSPFAGEDATLGC